MDFDFVFLVKIKVRKIILVKSFNINQNYNKTMIIFKMNIRYYYVTKNVLTRKRQKGRVE